VDGLGARDGERVIDWSSAAADYARFRGGPPERWFETLAAQGLGLPGQRVLDLATGTGLVALRLARAGCVVSGIDVAAGQLEEARAAAREQGLAADFHRAPAEELPFAPRSFELFTAHQCWLYFDVERTLAELRRVGVPGATLVIGHTSWLPLEDPLAAATEELILRHNPDWTAAGYDGRFDAKPAWAAGRAEWRGAFAFDLELPFTHASWRGRIRASRPVGATLSPAQVAAFDRELAELLAARAPDPCTVRHRCDARWFRL
jgi:SAM-dependent methyltransferase